MADNFDINLGAELRRQRETIILLFFVLKRAKQCHFMRFCAVSFPRCIFYSYHNRITAVKKRLYFAASLRRHSLNHSCLFSMPS